MSVSHDRQKIIPYLYYEDGVRALEYLVEVLGFQEKLRMMRDDGTLMHAEAGYEGNVVMLGSPDGSSQGSSDGAKAGASGSVMCYVANVDVHYERVRGAGATIVAELEDKPYGERMYAARDPEGHMWYFSTPL